MAVGGGRITWVEHKMHVRIVCGIGSWSVMSRDFWYGQKVVVEMYDWLPQAIDAEVKVLVA
eukprot:3764465-Prorocentrum_lima.AAC.1